MKLTLLALFAVALSAAPVLLPDGVPVDPNDPHIGRYVRALPGTTWLVGGEDCPPGLECGQNDWNDAMMSVSFRGMEATATFLGGTSYWANYFTLEGFSVLAGVPVVVDGFRLGEKLDIILKTGYGKDYAIGTWNIYAKMVCDPTGPDPVPEPGTLILTGLAFIAIGVRMAGRGRQA